MSTSSFRKCVPDSIAYNIIVFFFSLPYSGSVHQVLILQVRWCFSSLYMLHSPSVLFISISTSQCWSSYLSVSTHFHLACSHYYFFLCLSLLTISVLVFLSVSVHPLPSCVFSLLYLSLSFSPNHLSVGLPICQSPPTSILRVLITISFSLFLS